MQSKVTVIEKVSVKEFYESYKSKLSLDLITPASDLSRLIREKSINRPALALTGYMKHFAYKRLQLFGAGEMGFLKDLSPQAQDKVLHAIYKLGIPCIVVSRNLVPTKAMVKIAEKYKIPFFRTKMKSKDFSAEATVLLEEKMAPRTSLHGTLLDVRGMGALIIGKSGIGKSECALALVNRGHSLVADDLVHVKLVSRDLVGAAAQLSRGFMETRGIGIINIVDIFGVRAVRLQKRIDIVIRFLEWTPELVEDRTGLDRKTINILGVEVPLIELPVRPGRDMAQLVEIATMVHALKILGHDSAQHFNEKLIQEMASKQSI